MRFDLISYLSETFLFSGIEKKDIEELINNTEFEIAEFKKNEKIFLPEEYCKKIGFIISGECIVERLRFDGSYIPLNVLNKYDSFGIMAVLSEVEEFPTTVVSKNQSKILFISQNDFVALIKSNASISMNVIKFLAKKISFLNKKITTFSSDTVMQKLANYILMRHKEANDSPFQFSYKKASDSLGCARASVYRAVALFIEKDIISIENKILNIKNITQLERISK